MDERAPPAEANQHVNLDITKISLDCVKNKAGTFLHRKPPSNPTIFRVPPSLRNGNLRAYEPKLVSIGPYHRSNSDLKATEELKWRLLHHYLSKVPNGSKNEGLKEMKNLEKRARNCFSEVINLNSDQFVEMLLLDGCFLVQIFITYDEKDLHEGELKSLLENNWWFANRVVSDLLLLENQVPYFIVEHLLETLEMPGWNNSRLQQVAISWFSTLLPQYCNVPEVKLPAQGFQDMDHLLHLFHKWILSIKKSDKVLPCSSYLSDKFLKSVPSVTELAEAGVRMKESKANSFLTISFCKGVLKIPAINVDDCTNFFFANLIALEQCCRRHGMDITHYTMFLVDIIKTPRDVELLHRRGIIHRDLGSDKDIASLINKLGSGPAYNLQQNYLADVHKGLNAYRQSRWPRWRAKAVRDYFNNPWALISFAAAVLLLGLAIVQSVYAVVDYYRS